MASSPYRKSARDKTRPSDFLPNADEIFALGWGDKAAASNLALSDDDSSQMSGRSHRSHSNASSAGMSPKQQLSPMRLWNSPLRPPPTTHSDAGSPLPSSVVSLGGRETDEGSIMSEVTEGGGMGSESDWDAAPGDDESLQSGNNETEDQLWESIEKTVNVKSEVRREAGEWRRRRLQKEIEYAEKDVTHVLGSQKLLQSDYAEGLLMLLLWSFVVVFFIQFSGYHTHLYMILKPLLVLLTLMVSVIAAMYWYETKKSGEAMDSVLAARLDVVKGQKRRLR